MKHPVQISLREGVNKEYRGHIGTEIGRHYLISHTSLFRPEAAWYFIFEFFYQWMRSVFGGSAGNSSEIAFTCSRDHCSIYGTVRYNTVLRPSLRAFFSQFEPSTPSFHMKARVLTFVEGD